MKLILVKFDNVLGLNGVLNFVEGKPLLIYGENIAGKTNIINMLRYCLTPKTKEPKKYAEEKRIGKDEILLKENSSGSVEIYFEQNGKFYKLYYYFSRKGKDVNQIQKLYESELVTLPSGDQERIEVLSKLTWKNLGVSSIPSLKEKLVELGVYPEILDILISPSNVRNFAEAISGNVVRVPEIIEKRISNLHKNAERYLKNLQKLYNVLILEKENLEEKEIKELRKKFEEISKNLPEVNVNEVFVEGMISQNLQNLQEILIKKIESIPTEISKIKEISGLLSSEKYDIWTKAIDKIAELKGKKEELKDLIKRKESLEGIKKSLEEWKIIFSQLPSDLNLEGLISFQLPSIEKFDFNVLSNPEGVKSIFFLISEAKNLLQYTIKICEGHKIPVKISEINNLIKSYEGLLKAIKSPLEPQGDPALISEREEKVVVSIPLDIVVKKMKYLKGIEPTPLIHRPQTIEKEKFEKEIADLQDEINNVLTELMKARNNLTIVEKYLKDAKNRRENIDNELKNINEKYGDFKNKFEDLTRKIENAYHHLCESFNLEEEELNFSTEDFIETSFEKITKSYEEAQNMFIEDLNLHLKDLPEILQKLRISKDESFSDVIKKIKDELERSVKEVLRLQEEYKKLKDWILANINQIKSIENRIATINIMISIITIAQDILSRIYQKSDIGRIVEELAAKIEETVKDVYDKIFPFDKTFDFKHIGKGEFLSTIDGEPITHPSGSQRVAISLGIMLSLADTFRLPMILDEAFDRLDINRLKYFCECITGLSETYQICLAAYTSYNIEKNQEVLPLINNWKIYLVKRENDLEKNIKPLQTLPLHE